jgi:putative IMPACT (imprinted ancient) family translation regulator
MMTENQVTVLACLFTDNSSFSVTNVLIVVVRIFGVKLGVGGLIAAYKQPHKWFLKPAKLSKTIDIHFIITFDYVNMNKVMRIIKELKS